jgi:beta-lactamase class A
MVLSLAGPGGAIAASLDAVALARAVEAVAARLAPGALGVAVEDLATGLAWSRDGQRPFPMQSVFKAPLGAAVLAASDAGRLDLDGAVTLTASDLSPPYSRIAAAFPQRVTYTVRELLEAAAGGSDNTAADVLMARLGGPGEVTRWLRTQGVEGMRVDRYEREFQAELAGLPAFRAEWATEAGFAAALANVPIDRRRRALAAYLADPRDTATPLAAVDFLRRLAGGRLLSPGSTRTLLEVMTRTTTGARRLKAGLPAAAVLAHKTGSARPELGQNPALHDVGLVTLPGGRTLALAVFTGSTTAPFAEVESAIADVARAVVAALR